MDLVCFYSKNLFKRYGVYLTSYGGVGYKIGHTRNIVVRNRCAKNDGWNCALSTTVFYCLEHIYPTDFTIIESFKKNKLYYFSASELFVHACFRRKRIVNGIEANIAGGSTEIFDLNWFDRYIKLPLIMKMIGAKRITSKQLVKIEKEQDSYINISEPLIETVKYFDKLFRIWDGKEKNDNLIMSRKFNKINEENGSQFTSLESAQKFFDSHLENFPNTSSSKLLIELQKIVLKCVDELHSRNDGQIVAEEIISQFTGKRTVGDRKITISVDKKITQKHWLYGQVWLESERHGKDICLIFSPRSN